MQGYQQQCILKVDVALVVMRQAYRILKVPRLAYEEFEEVLVAMEQPVEQKMEQPEEQPQQQLDEHPVEQPEQWETFPPPRDPRPSDHSNDNNNYHQQSRKLWCIQELQYATLIGTKDAKRFEGEQGEDIEPSWIVVEVYRPDWPGQLPKDERTIGSIGFLIDTYATACHVKWLKGALSGKHPK